MSLLALAAFSVAQASGQNPSADATLGKITLSTGLVPVQRALEELSRATGLELQTTPATADFPVMIRVQGADTRTVLAKVADLLGAEWRQEGRAYVLSSDATLRRKLLNQPDTRRAAPIAEHLQKAVEAAHNLKFDRAYAERMREDEEKLRREAGKHVGGAGEKVLIRLPRASVDVAQRAIYQLLQNIGAADLAALVPGERTVYALTPTQTQAVFPPKSREILEAYLKDARAFEEAKRATRRGAQNDEPVDRDFTGEDPGRGKIWDAHLEVWATDRTLMANLTLFDANGESLAHGHATLKFPPPQVSKSKGGDRLKVSSLGREWGAKLKAASRDFALQHNPEIEVGFVFNFGGPNDEILGRSISPALKALLAKADGGNLAAPLFEPVASAIPGDLIATVPDSGLVTLAEIVSDENTTFAGAVAALEAAPEFSTVREGGLTLVGASTPGQLRRQFADRAALRELVRAIGDVGYLRLDDAARYAVVQREVTGATNLGAPIYKMLDGESAIAIDRNALIGDFQLLRIYGSLTSGQRAALDQGRSVAYTSLSADGTDALGRFLYNSVYGPHSDRQELMAPAQIYAGVVSGVSRRPYERTVRFGEGLPRDGFFTLGTTESESYLMMNGKSGAKKFGDANTFSLLRERKGDAANAATTFRGGYDRFTPARKRALRFKFVFGPDVTMSRTLNDSQLLSTASVTFEQLPEEFRKRVATSRAGIVIGSGQSGRIRP